MDGKTIGKFIYNLLASLWDDVILPAAKDMIADTLNSAVQRGIYGESESRSRSRRRPVRYDRASETRGRSGSRRRKRTVSINNFDYELKYLRFDSRRDANAIIAQMTEYIKTYGVCTVLDLYSAAGVSTNHNDDKWGWENLKGIRPTHIAAGEWTIDFADNEPEYLK